jgi:hypothetical protein
MMAAFKCSRLVSEWAVLGSWVARAQFLEIEIPYLSGGSDRATGPGGTK